MITLTAEQAQQIEEALVFIPALMSDSKGVAGYHLNGEIADWDEFDEVNMVHQALATIRAARSQAQEPVAANCPKCKSEISHWSWCPDFVQPVSQKQEPLMDYERINALREGEQNGAEDAYFFVRPENDTPTLRKMFCQGFERGFHKGLKYAAPARTKDLTDDEIVEIMKQPFNQREYLEQFARAVIAAYREKNRA